MRTAGAATASKAIQTRVVTYVANTGRLLALYQGMKDVLIVLGQSKPELSIEVRVVVPG